jgi:hypothetical protein
MRFFERFGRRIPDAELDERLTAIFDDRRTPAAPRALYSFVREVPMVAPEPISGRARRRWQALTHPGRTAFPLAAIVVVVLVAAVAIVLPRSIGSGSGATESAGPVPSAPVPPAGWQFGEGFGGEGQVGANLLPAQAKIALHVVCTGPGKLIVLASTVGLGGAEFGVPVQAVEFQCDMSGSEGRAELTSTTGDFQLVRAMVVASPSDLARTSFYVSIEVPIEAPAPSAS